MNHLAVSEYGRGAPPLRQVSWSITRDGLTLQVSSLCKALVACRDFITSSQRAECACGLSGMDLKCSCRTHLSRSSDHPHDSDCKSEQPDRDDLPKGKIDVIRSSELDVKVLR